MSAERLTLCYFKKIPKQRNKTKFEFSKYTVQIYSYRKNVFVIIQVKTEMKNNTSISMVGKVITFRK